MHKRRFDEYGLELTKEEQQEIDEIAKATVEDVMPRVKKRPGRPKKSEAAADGKFKVKPAESKKDPEPEKVEVVPEESPEEPQKDLNTFTTRILPIEVRNAIEEKMEIYEKTIKSYEDEIGTLKDRIKTTEGKYLVLANYLTGAKAHNEGKEPQAAAGGETARIDA